MTHSAVRWALGLATALLFVAGTTPVADAQCDAGVKIFASVKSAQAGYTQLRVDPGSSGSVVADVQPSHTRGLERGRFWQSDDSTLGNNFVPGDPEKKMAPAGCGGVGVCCASTDPAQTPDGGWWQVTQTTKAGVHGAISSTGCTANTCPFGDMTHVVEDWGSAGPPGVLDTAFFIAWRTNATPAELRNWDLAKPCAGTNCTVPFAEFPVPLITSDTSPGTFTVRSNTDPAANVYVHAPAAGPASEVIQSFDVMIHHGASDPGRDRNALCGGGRCWEPLAQVPYADAALSATQVDVACDPQQPLDAFIALGLSFVGGVGGPVPSQLVGRAIALDCSCEDLDGDGAGCDDCDDGDPDNFVGNPETCDGQDNDCDDLIDENDPDLSAPWYLDFDGDGSGNPDQTLDACTQPVDYVANNSDCDDLDSANYPGNAEVSDGQDNDCDTLVDDADPDITGQTTWYLDGDGDGSGDPTQSLVSCDEPDGYVDDGSDCDDANPANFPGNPEICDDQDNDCDTLVDDADPSVENQPVWFRDVDGDGFGDPDQAVVTCDQPTGFVAETECDDANSNVYPGAAQLCDGVNNDCTHPQWPGLQGTNEFDDDSDQFTECSGDCDDGKGATYPGAAQICDGVNNDCSDEGWPSLAGTNDGDDDLDTFSECGGDCDDSADTVFPGAPQACDGVNNDCGDPGWPALPPSEIDDDGDAFRECDGDCDDTDPDVHPGAEESCNGIDDDCDGQTDEDAGGEDTDGDGVNNVCDICPQIANPGQQETVACIETFSNGGPCLHTLVDLVTHDASGEIQIYDAGGILFSATPFTAGDLPSNIDIAALPDGAGTLCVEEASGAAACAGFVKQGEQALGINDPDCGAPTAVADSILLSECGSPGGVHILLDGSGSTDSEDDIELFEWFEDYGLPEQSLLGAGETLEVLFPVGLHLVTLRVTDSAGATDTSEIAVRFLLKCWMAIDPVTIALEESESGTVLHWPLAPGAESYDVIRGQLGRVEGSPTFIRLGPVVCIEDDSVNAGTTDRPDPDLPQPGEAFFYVVRQQGETQGIYGIGSAVLPRIAGLGDCPQER